MTTSVKILGDGELFLFFIVQRLVLLFYFLISFKFSKSACGMTYQMVSVMLYYVM